jgi:hypothetical protein
MTTWQQQHHDDCTLNLSLTQRPHQYLQIDLPASRTRQNHVSLFTFTIGQAEEQSIFQSNTIPSCTIFVFQGHHRISFFTLFRSVPSCLTISAIIVTQAQLEPSLETVPSNIWMQTATRSLTQPKALWVDLLNCRKKSCDRSSSVNVSLN